MNKNVPITEPGAASSGLESAFRVAGRFQRFAFDMLGVTALAAALMTLLGVIFPSLTDGVLILLWLDFLRIWLGWGSLWVVLLLCAAGLLCLYRGSERPAVAWGRIFALEAAAFSSLALLAALGGGSLQRADGGLDGGRIGWALNYLGSLLLSPLGMGSRTWQLLFSTFFFILFMLFGTGLLAPLAGWLARRLAPDETAATPDSLAGNAVSMAPISASEASPAADDTRKKRTLLPAEFRKKFRIQDDREKVEPAVPLVRDDRLPGLDLLVNEQAFRPDERNINLTAGLIEKTLSEFGIPARVVGFRVGPTVTQFAVEPGFVEKTTGSVESDANRQKVRVSQISALSRDLALALSAERLRIEAPVPGRPYVGIEVPNLRSMVVRLRPILESDVFYKTGSPLAVALGRDVSGQPVVADLGRMPHLLIAGTTGSGKSVCIAALTACLVMNNSPEDLRLLMIDPKMVELVRFNGLPHLLGRVETDLERILAVLRWTVAEMDRRYKLLEASHSRNLDSYNRKARRRKGEAPLPRLVLLIDELADLMMSAPDQTEPALVRLAQMARATGIHLVVATQRPSTDVVTGLIKANFPARISFSVASSIDSRVILDTTGAETLLGHGDMLFLPPEASGPIRAQGVMITDPEVEKVITFWQKAMTSGEVAAPPWEEMLQHDAVMADRDGLIEQAIQICRESKRISASLLQRRLRIGYPRAARLVDELEEMGVIASTQSGSRDREVLIDPEDGES